MEKGIKGKMYEGSGIKGIGYTTISAMKKTRVSGFGG